MKDLQAKRKVAAIRAEALTQVHSLANEGCNSCKHGDSSIGAAY